MILDEGQSADNQGNHPLAERMGVIAALSHNIIIGSIFGTFSVMLDSVQQRLGVSPAEASVGVPLVVIGSALMASVVGVLMSRFSLQRLLTIGAALCLAAYLTLAFTTSYAGYIVAYGLLLGPGMSLAGSVGPATLVTRWFSRNRGLALGLVHLPIVVAILPVVSNWVLMHYGAQATYLMLAGMIGIVLLPMTLLARDYPPGARPAALAGQEVKTADGSLTVPQLLAMPSFWAFAISGSAVATGAVLLGTVLIPMAMSWGIDRPHAAVLASIMSLVGIVGSVAFGWVADRLGGARGLALLCINLAILWGILLLRPSYGVLAVVIGLIGMHGAGMIPNLSRGLADAYGAASFSRGFGMATTLSLPFTVVAVIGSSMVYGATGSFAIAISGMIALFVIAAPFTLLAARKTKPVSPA